MSKLSKLFRWNKKLDIMDGGAVVATVYLRVIGDSDYAEARDYALLRSKELRNKLRNPDTIEYKSSFADIDSLTKEEMINSIAYSEIATFRDEAITLFPEKDPPPPPETNDLEEQEKYQDKLQKFKDNRAREISEHMMKRSEETSAELANESQETLLSKYKDAVINSRCSQEFMNKFNEYCSYKSVYADDKFRALAFDSFEDYEHSSPILKRQIEKAYTSLEVSGEELKN